LNYRDGAEQIAEFCSALQLSAGVPLVVVVDDAEFVALSPSNWLWVTFTRSNPSHDIYGVDSFVEYKHWGCRGSLVIDARIKPHHAPPLIEDAKVAERVERDFSWIWQK
jgi:4-hydroxy-3-polyprenylbenzoate decarboxylase